MLILGLATMTESSAALVRDGKLLAAVEEERFTRVKHAGGFPHLAVDYVLKSQGLTLADVDHVAVAWNPYKLGHRFRYLTETLIRHPALFLERMRRAVNIWNGVPGEGGWSSLFSVQKQLDKKHGASKAKLHYMDHHACHIASAFYPSSFEEAAILIMDGAGEAACTTWGRTRNLDFEILDQHLLPHSLGHFYSAITGYLGFRIHDGEYKVMGLSPYGDPSGAKWIEENYLQRTGNARYFLNSRALDYHRSLRGVFDGTFQKYFGAARRPDDEGPVDDRHQNVATAAQQAFENIVIDMGREIRRMTGLNKLIIAGGCGLNCKANGKLLTEGVFDELYVPAVPHDAGGSLGAALLLYTKLSGKRPDPIATAQFGPEFDDASCGEAIRNRSDVVGEKLEQATMIDNCAKTLAGGGVVAWFQGRMEYGPRALGNRSLLADPRSDTIRDSINIKIKKREPFRPFAPSVKAEKGSYYFELNQSAPFMTLAVPVRPERRNDIPAVTHVDGSARPQTVDKAVNPRYWELLDRFESYTGVPVLLNTSYNIQEPIVCTPSEAVATFANSGIDALALGNHWVRRKKDVVPQG